MARRFDGARIGIDLDNTLISYDLLFQQVAVRRALIPNDFRGSKREIRDRIRSIANGEIEWQRLQAIVYGPEISGAAASEGALDFIRTARAHGADLSIVSHKTSYSNLGTETVNLREAALRWLRDSGMVGPAAVPEARVFFESTRSEKIARIISLSCTHFIDDLEEVFDDPAFPADIERMLLSGATQALDRDYRSYSSFREIADAFASD